MIAVNEPAPIAAAPKLFEEQCTKCRGTGRYGRPSSYGTCCFACGGSGKKVFKNSAEDRAAARVKAAERKVKKEEAAYIAWAKEFPAEAAWLDARAATNDFALSLRNAVGHYGRLTPNQLGVVQSRIKGEENRLAAQAARPPAAPIERPKVDAANVAKIVDAFNQAKKKVRYPKLRLSGENEGDRFIFSPAPDTGVNAGAIYVKQQARAMGEVYEGAYLGKILGGSFFRSRDCTEETEKAVLAVASDPETAAVAYGKRYGVCSVCDRDLSDEKSVERGIGPVCAKRMGW